MSTTEAPIEPTTEDQAIQTVFEIDYPEALLRLWRFADHESLRFSINFVRVDFQNQFVEATNGSIIVRETLTIPDEWHGFKSVLFYGEDLERIFEMFKKRNSRHGLKLVKDGDNWYAQNDLVRMTIQTDGSSYPNTSEVFNPKPDRVVKFILSIDLLRKFLKAFDSDDIESCNSVAFSVPLSGGFAIDLSCSGGKAKARFATMASSSDDGQSIRIEPPFEAPAPTREPTREPNPCNT